jgi:hypothetical protein
MAVDRERNGWQLKKLTMLAYPAAFLSTQPVWLDYQVILVN